MILGRSSRFVIASKAKQSRNQTSMISGLLRRYAPRNDGESTYLIPHYVRPLARASASRMRSGVNG
jgi:hypothetical protein